MKNKFKRIIIISTSKIFVFLNSVIQKFPNLLKGYIAESRFLTGVLDLGYSSLKLVVSSRHSLLRLRSGTKEKHTVKWIESFLPSDVFYDIGSNVGAYSLMAAKNNKCKSIFAFEPVPGTFHELLSNIRLNNISNITACNICLSDSISVSHFNLNSILPGDALHGGILENPSNSISFLCPTITLDDFIILYSAPIPNHIKIDVDGAELAILKGAANTLINNSVRSLQIELNEESDSYFEILKILKLSNFQLKEKHQKDIQVKEYDALFEKIYQDEY